MHRYHHNPEQQQQLLSDIQELIGRLLSIDFAAPTDDELNIRHYAYLKGRLEATKDMYKDNFPEPEPQTET